jgi:FAD/FMN-containing dehydrogenase
MQKFMNALPLELDHLPIVRKDSAEGAIYHEAVFSRVFNQRRPSRYPRAVIEASSPSHVVEAVKLAIQEDCRVSVRSGGHSWAAWSVRDDAILVDLGNLKSIEYNAETHIATCSPSTTGRMLNSFLAENGRMFGGGHCPDVGLGGFLLQGGMGWNCKACPIFDQGAGIGANYLLAELGLGV